MVTLQDLVERFGESLEDSATLGKGETLIRVCFHARCQLIVANLHRRFKVRQYHYQSVESRLNHGIGG